MFLCFIYLNSFEHPYKNHVEWDRLKHLLMFSFLAIFTMGGIYFSIPLISDLAKNLALVHELGIEVPMFLVGTAYERTHVFHFTPPWDSDPFHDISVPCTPGGNHRRQTSILFKSEVQLSLPVASSDQQNLSRFIDSWVWNKILCCELWGIREGLLQNSVTATAE